jgi:Fic family protein
MVLLLILTERLEIPILFLSGYINKNRPEYYRLLNLVTAESAWKEWILFILNAIEVQSKETAKTINDINNMREEYKRSIKTKLPKIYSADLVDYLFANPFYSQQGLAKAIEKERKTSAKYLNLLLAEGLIETFTIKREKIYFCSHLLKLLS